jgi:hypothetical protein
LAEQEKKKEKREKPCELPYLENLEKETRIEAR